MEDYVVLYHDYDLLVIPLVFIFFYFLGKTLSRNIKDREMRGYFIYGMLVKMLAAIAYGFIIQFYFKGGDTNRYYVALLDLKNAVNDDPMNLFHIYGHIQLTNESPIATYLANDKLGDNLIYMVKTSNFMVPRFGLIFSYIFGNSYTALSMCYSFFAFWGCWKCFTVFAKLFPTVKRGLAISFLFYPTVVYWGSSIMKDSICLGALGLFIYSFYSLFFQKRRIGLHIVLMIFWGTIMFLTKPYLLLSLVPGLALWFFLHTNKSIKDRGVRMISFGILLAIIASSVLLLIQFMLSLDFLELDKYKAENIAQYATQSQQGYLEAGGSSFSIGTMDGSMGSFLSMFPKAVNATLFRPYLWEAKNPVILISALESFIVLCLFLFGLIKLGFRKFFSGIFSSPVLTFMFIYSFILSGLVAITTNNFGSLVRYKIPAMPFFVSMLIILISQIPDIKKFPFLANKIFSKKVVVKKWV